MSTATHFDWYSSPIGDILLTAREGAITRVDMYGLRSDARLDSDWIEGGDGFDTLAGDNSELFFNSTIKGHDVLLAGENENDFDAESGDDIMVQGESVMRNEGMFGFDWAIHKGNRIAADSDMRIPIFTTAADDILRFPRGPAAGRSRTCTGFSRA